MTQMMNWESITFKISGEAVIDDGYGNRSFIGREGLLFHLLELFRTPSKERYGFSGLFKNGKTSLFKEVQRNINLRNSEKSAGRIIAVYFNIQMWETKEFLSAIMGEVIKEVRRQIREKANDSEYRAYFDQVTQSKSDEACAAAAEECLVFLRENRINIVLFLDEFQMLAPGEDSKKAVIQSCTFQKLACLNNLSFMKIAYIGRLPFDMTVSMMPSCPANEMIPCEQKTVHGFDDQDIELYYRVFEGKYGFNLKQYQEEIQKHCGRSPYLYAVLATELQTMLRENRYDDISLQWIQSRLMNDRLIEAYRRHNIEAVLKKDNWNGMDCLTRLQRIMIGPRIGIRRNDEEIMRQMGYIDSFGPDKPFAVTPSFVEWLKTQEITGELPSKMVRAEKLLKHLIRKKANAIIAQSEHADTVPERTGDYLWQRPLDRAILGMELRKVPATRAHKGEYGSRYWLDDAARKKYASWLSIDHAVERPSDLLDVLLLQDRLAILLSRWDLFIDEMGDSAAAWRERLISWSVARNPALHASDYLSEADEAACEKACDDFLRVIGPMFPNVH